MPDPTEGRRLCPGVGAGRAFSRMNSPDAIPVLMLHDGIILSTANRPRRVFDFNPLLAKLPGARLVAPFQAESDVELDAKLDRMGPPPVRRWKFFFAGLWSLLTHLGTLRRSVVIFGFSPHHFWWLAMLWRVGLFPVRGKTVIGIFSRSTPFLKKLGLLRRLPPEFLPYFMVPRQIEDLVRAGCPRERLHGFSWRIDSDWYVPAPEKSLPTGKTGGYILCAGMAYRDEALVAALVGTLGRKLVRATRTEHLRAYYEEQLGDKAADPELFEYLVLRDHRAYLRTLQNADLMILPVRSTDEPAGLTTALEAFACEVPLVANSSYGVTELLEQGYGLAPVASNDPALWRAAIGAALRGETITGEALQRGRQLVRAKYHAGDGIEDWRDLEAVRREVDAAG